MAAGLGTVDEPRYDTIHDMLVHVHVSQFDMDKLAHDIYRDALEHSVGRKWHGN